MRAPSRLGGGPGSAGGRRWTPLAGRPAAGGRPGQACGMMAPLPGPGAARVPTPPHRQPVVAVFGSSTVREPDVAWREAHELGAALARRGVATMSGGYGGAMAAVSRGAHEAGGHVIGVTVDLFERRGPVNPWVRERVHTPDIFERL